MGVVRVGVRAAGRSVFALAVLCAALVAFLVGAAPAQAKEYRVASAAIDAQVGADGIIDVVEERDFRFVGEHSYAYWDFDGAAGEAYQFAKVEELPADGSGAVEYREGQLGEAGTYAISREPDRVLLRLHVDKADTHATFRVSYRVAGAVSRFSDVGQLYWRLVPQGLTEGQQMANLSCSIALPAPAGTALVLGEGTDANLLAWSHGSLDASMEVGGDRVNFTFPHVDAGKSEYAEAVVAFPSAWLSGMAASPWRGMPAILQQEGGRTSLADSVRLVTLAQLVGCVAIFVIATLVCYLVFRRYGRNHRARFKEEYWREPPMPDHPAVIGYVWNGLEAKPAQLATTLLHLAGQGQLGVSRELLPEELRTRRRAKTELVALNPAAAPVDAIDRAALGFFSFVAAGAPAFAAEDLRGAARRDPAGFRAAYQAWEQAVREQAKRAGYVARNHRALGLVLGAVSVLMLCGSIAVLALALSPGVGALTVLLAGVVPLACTVSVFAMALFSERRNRESTEALAKCQAFNRWLAHLPQEEAGNVPQDPVQWGRLLVCASATDAVESLVSGLRAAAPQAEASSVFQIPFGWCYQAARQGVSVKATGLEDLVSILADAVASVN